MKGSKHYILKCLQLAEGCWQSSREISQPNFWIQTLQGQAPPAGKEKWHGFLPTCLMQSQPLSSPALYVPSFSSVSPFPSLPLGHYTFSRVWSGLLLCTHTMDGDKAHIYFTTYIWNQALNSSVLYLLEPAAVANPPSPFTPAPSKVLLLFISYFTQDGLHFISVFRGLHWDSFQAQTPLRWRERKGRK